MDKPQKKLSQKSAKEILDDLETLSSNEELIGPQTPERQTLQQAMARAKQMYQDRATANEWGEVAQTVGQALARAAAAREGLKTNRDMSNLNMGPGFDFQNRGNRLFKEYQQEVQDAQELDKLDRAGTEEQQGFNQKRYGRQENSLETALRLARDKEEEQNRLARERLGKDGDTARESKQDARLQLQDLRQQEQDLKKQLLARQQLANELTREEDLTPKAAKKLQEKYGSLAAQGDLDLAGLQSELTSTDKPGRLWGTNPDPEARRTTLGSKVQEIKQMLDEVRARKEQLLGASAAPAVAPTQKPTTSTPAGMVKLRAPDGTVGLVPEAQVKAALQAGATLVE